MLGMEEGVGGGSGLVLGLPRDKGDRAKEGVDVGRDDRGEGGGGGGREGRGEGRLVDRGGAGSERGGGVEGRGRAVAFLRAEVGITRRGTDNDFSGF